MCFVKQVHLQVQLHKCKPSAATVPFNVEDPEAISSDHYKYSGMSADWPPGDKPPPLAPQDPAFVLLTGQLEQWNRAFVRKDWQSNNLPVPKGSVCLVKKRVYKKVVLYHCIGAENPSLVVNVDAR